MLWLIYWCGDHPGQVTHIAEQSFVPGSTYNLALIDKVVWEEGNL